MSKEQVAKADVSPYVMHQYNLRVLVEKSLDENTTVWIRTLIPPVLHSVLLHDVIGPGDWSSTTIVPLDEWVRIVAAATNAWMFPREQVLLEGLTETLQNIGVKYVILIK